MSKDLPEQPSEEATGWTKIWIRVEFAKLLDELGESWLQYHIDRGGQLPARFVDKGHVSRSYVLSRCVASKLDHAARSTTGDKKDWYLEMWRQVAQLEGLGPFGKNDR